MERRAKERWRGGRRRGGEEGEGEVERRVKERGGEEGEGEVERRVKERWRGGTAEEAEARWR